MSANVYRHDIMHIVLEGTMPQEIKLSLWQQATDNLHLFTLNWLNEEIGKLQLTGIESKYRIWAIDRNTLNFGGHKLNQSGQYIFVNTCLYYLESSNY